MDSRPDQPFRRTLSPTCGTAAGSTDNIGPLFSEPVSAGRSRHRRRGRQVLPGRLQSRPALERSGGLRPVPDRRVRQSRADLPRPADLLLAADAAAAAAVPADRSRSSRPRPPAPAATEATVSCSATSTRAWKASPRGTIKYLRILEQVPRPWAARRFWPDDEALGQHAVISLNAHIHVKIQHGVVPVREDGSAHFIVPPTRTSSSRRWTRTTWKSSGCGRSSTSSRAKPAAASGAIETRAAAPPPREPLALARAARAARTAARRDRAAGAARASVPMAFPVHRPEHESGYVAGPYRWRCQDVSEDPPVP